MDVCQAGNILLQWLNDGQAAALAVAGAEGYNRNKAETSFSEVKSCDMASGPRVSTGLPLCVLFLHVHLLNLSNIH